MKLQDLGEDQLVERLISKLGATASGIGDDCAVLRRGRVCQLLKTDCLVEGIHFLREQPAQKVGWKALCRAISDVGAMGGTPKEALLTIAAPRELFVSYLEEFYEGLRSAAARFEVRIVGGETARSPGPIFISVALTGEVAPSHLVLRSGGKVADRLFVTGTLGGSIHGKHLSFTPRVEEARWLTQNFQIHAMMDLSDGLGHDLPRLAKASGCGFSIDRNALPLSAESSGVEAAMSDGEDYELLFAVAPKTAVRLRERWPFQLELTEIGVLTPERDSIQIPGGYDHFAQR